MELLTQFERYLNNQLTNELVEEPTIKVPYTAVSEESFYVSAKGLDDEEYYFEYNAYFTTEEGASLYDFTPISKEEIDRLA